MTKWHLSELNRAWKHSAGCNNYARWPKSFYLVPGKYGPVRRPGCWDSAAASLTLSSAVRLGFSNTTKYYTQNQRRRLRNTFIDLIKNHWHPQETIRHRGLYCWSPLSELASPYPYFNRCNSRTEAKNHNRMKENISWFKIKARLFYFLHKLHSTAFGTQLRNMLVQLPTCK